MANEQDKLVGPVPSRIVNTASLTLTPHEGKIAEFNVAAWLQLPGLATLPVSLVVTYRDGEQRRVSTVDHGKLNAQGKILLTGVARLPVRVKIEEMQVRLKCAVPVHGLIVEELFVQAVEPARGDSRHALA
ncbi:hypothetical protein [Pseudomonas sp. RIT-PI-AD]|uniref:hypothetical protein n=1 Tax=Pseudomonas sp. RIT-PI-AD TaxID=3035294 RepID=UPI0021D9E8E0|nr:hypothetical protein [Pseudomonas sp. RIT-PI-AD]